jgi:TonB family protein
MKRCPTCQRVYQDEMSYCLEDGATLLREAETSSGASETMRIPAPRLTNQSPTEILPASETQPAQPTPQFAHQRHAAERMAAPQRKSKALPWILGAVILGLVGVVVGLMMMRGRDDTRTAQNTVQSENTSENTTASPESSPADSPMETPVGAPTPASETRSTPTERASEQASPTPKPTQSPKSSPPMVVADEPPPPPPPRPTPPRSGAPISGGILNGKAVSMPKPAYPAVARAARASGTVTVQVTIDESGKVASARAITGHPLLQQAAVQAAYGARFSPTLLSGQPVKVTGVITYNFVAQ